MQRFFLKWRSEPNTVAYNPVNRRPFEEVRKLLESDPGELSTISDGEYRRWFVMVDDRPVGTVSVGPMNAMMNTSDIGYMIGQEFQGRGYATQAVRLWVNMLFAQTNLRRLTASVAEQNHASLRVIEKAGFCKEGLLREHFVINNQPVNQVFFGLLRSEFISRN